MKTTIEAFHNEILSFTAGIHTGMLCKDIGVRHVRTLISLVPGSCAAGVVGLRNLRYCLYVPPLADIHC